MRMLNNPLTDALYRRTLAEIQRKVVKQGKRNVASRLVHAKGDKDKIVAWTQDLLRVLNVFNVCLITSWSFDELNGPLSDRTGNQYQHGGRGHLRDGRGYPSKCIGRTRGCF